jgi:hypothetical protein
MVLAVRGNEPKTVPEVELTVMHARRTAQLAKFCTVSGFFRIEEDRNKILPLAIKQIATDSFYCTTGVGGGGVREWWKRLGREWMEGARKKKKFKKGKEERMQRARNMKREGSR